MNTNVGAHSPQPEAVFYLSFCPVFFGAHERARGVESQASVRFMGGTDASDRGFNFVRRLLLEHAQQDVQAEPHHHAGDYEHQDP
jgi:hypothetical protein